MKGMMLNHTHELVQCIVEVRELMDLKSLRMGDYSLAMRQRAQAGHDYLSLVTEYLDYVGELEEITETYIEGEFEELSKILDPYLQLRVDKLLIGIQ